MKIAIGVILFLLVMSQSFKNWIIITEYDLNKDYITKVFCENRNRPKMHCDGKCILAKRMAAAEENETTPTAPQRPSWEVSIFVPDHLQYCSQTNSLPDLHFIPAEISFKEISFSSRIFRPPLS